MRAAAAALFLLAVYFAYALQAVRAAAPTATPSPKPTKTPARLHVNTEVEGNEASPIYIYGSSLRNGNGGTYMQCVSFRNVAPKVATDIVFVFAITDKAGAVVENFDLSKSGTFTPPVSIDDKCWVGYLWPDAKVRKMAREMIRVTRVTFEDATLWRPGLSFVRAYGNTGKKLEPPL